MDPAIVKYANRLEQKIVSGQTYVTITWLKVVDDREFNTFSLPGGFLSFSVGLIPDSENEVQQTAALAHETAHVTACQMTRVEMRSKIDRRRAFAARPLRSVTRRLFGPLLLAELVRNAEFDADQLVGGGFRIPTNGSGKADFLHAFWINTGRRKRGPGQQKSSASSGCVGLHLWTQMSFMKQRKDWRRRWLSTRFRNSGASDERHEKVP